jgi:hypothetical protein
MTRNLNLGLALAGVLLVANHAQCRAQSNASPVQAGLPPTRQVAAEDQFAKTFETYRAGLGHPRLHRRSPAKWQIELTCTVALDESKRKDAEVYGISIRAITFEKLNSTAGDLGKPLSNSTLEKDFPAYSVAIFNNPHVSANESTLIVGFVRLESRSRNLLGCFSTEDGCNDRSWERVIDPTCRGLGD